MDLSLESIAYTFVFAGSSNGTANVLTPGASLTFTDVSTGLGGTLAALTQGGGIQFGFNTPGQFGSFDQTAAETALEKVVTDVFQLISDITGTPVADLAKVFSVNRVWTWTDSSGNCATYTDTMPMPASA